MILTDTYSDHDMQCPAGWENGFKEGRILRSGEAERVLSHPWTGEWRGSTYTFQLSDYDQRFRQQLAGVVDRFWTEPLTVRMTTRANRAALGTPYTVFVGPIIDAQPIRPLAMEFTLGDLVSRVMLSDRFQVPWRIIRDGFLSQLTTISPDLDLETPEPRIYGEHIRVSGIDPASGQGFEIVPAYLGVETVSATPYHVWLIAGHACADIPRIRVDLVITPEGTDWLIPHQAGYLAEFGAPYQDRLSDTYGTLRRYTLLYGKVGEADPDGCASGEKQLTVAVEGVEPTGTGIGIVIRDRFTQYKHWLINDVAYHGKASYQSGAWLTNPLSTAYGVTVPVIDAASFDRCTAIANERFPTGDPAVPGYTGAAVIGARAGERASVLKWIADWNRSCGCRFGITRLGQARVTLLHPTTAIKAAAPLYTDAYEILDGSFEAPIEWGDHATEIPFRTDFDHATGQWMTADVVVEGNPEVLYNTDLPSEIREYPFAPGITNANHIATLEIRQRGHPPRFLQFEATIGPDNVGESLGYRELGDYIRYVHFAAISGDRQIRLAQVTSVTVRVGERKVRVECLDCEDLIGFDVSDGESVPATNSGCAEAIEIEPTVSLTQTWNINTLLAPTDESLTGVMPDGRVAYHAAWWKVTTAEDLTMTVQTPTTPYNTQIAVVTGTCGGSPIDWLLEAYNDDTLGEPQSGIAFTALAGVTYYIVVSGVLPTDKGALYFQANLEPL